MLRQCLRFLMWVPLTAASPALALERTAARVVDPVDEWNASATTTLHYYNNCNDWLWLWSGWSPGETVGVNFDTGPGCSPRPLNFVRALVASGEPSGYGFTGVIEVKSGLSCQSPVLAQAPWLPQAPGIGVGWFPSQPTPALVPRSFAVTITWAAPPGYTNGTALASDHPAAGATGPAACGICFPSNRMVHSRYFGVGGQYCPSGTTLNDGTCAIEWMMEAGIAPCPVGVNAELADKSWAEIKTLYK